MIYILFGFLGLSVGSFLNVVIFRFASGEGGIATGRSHCRTCDYELTWRDNIPVLSFLFLRGRCRQCDKKISWQYPVVEIANTIIWILIAVSFSLSIFSHVSLIFSALLLAAGFSALLSVFVYDLKYMEVPMVSVWIACACGVGSTLLQIFFGVGGLTYIEIFYYILGAACGFGFFFSLSYVSDERWMGYGDSYIALAMGLLMGPFGLFVSILLGTWVGAIIGIGLTVFGGKNMKTAIPFGPFLIGGMYLAFILMAFAPMTLDFLRL